MSNCNGNIYQIGMGCCEPVLGPIDAYYTKFTIDRKLEEITSAITSGCCITPEEVDEKIEEAISGITVSGVTEQQLNDAITSAKTEIEAEIPSLDGYATEAWVTSAITAATDGMATTDWVEAQHYITGVDLSDYATKEEIPSLDGYATQQWVTDQHYITGVDLSDYATTAYVNTQISSQTADFVTSEELSSYTYSKAVIDSKVASGGTFDPTMYYTTAQTNTLLDGKLDASAYTPCDLSDYYNKQEVNGIITSAITDVEAEIPSLSGYATQQWVEDKHYITGVDLSDYALKSEIPTVPTSNTAFTNDAGYITSSALNGYATTQEMNTAISAATSGKVDTSTYTAYTANTQTTINSKADSSTLNNYMLKSQIWCGTQQQWASISGNPDSNTIYLIHD